MSKLSPRSFIKSLLGYSMLMAALLFLLTPVFVWATTVNVVYGGIIYSYDPSTGAFTGSNGSSGYLSANDADRILAGTEGAKVTIVNNYADNTSAPVSFTT